jgi:hypothetical protein
MFRAIAHTRQRHNQPSGQTLDKADNVAGVLNNSSTGFANNRLHHRESHT